MKPNEKAHSPLKSFYQLMTNFKHVAEQVMYYYELLGPAAQLGFVADIEAQQE
jgi:hypothetical protein